MTDPSEIHGNAHVIGQQMAPGYEPPSAALNPPTDAPTCGHRPAPAGPQAAHNLCTLEPGHRGGHYDAVCHTDWPNDLASPERAPAFDATAANPLAVELWQILAGLDDDPNSTHLEPMTRERLERLAEHVERVGAEPDTTELTGSFGLDPEQEIRTRALDSATRLLAPVLGNRSLDAVDIDLDRIRRLWLDLAGAGADWIQAGIRDGSRPDDPERGR
jgi:hypothetical protein